MIDPKGDITNSLLHFPDLLPDDFSTVGETPMKAPPGRQKAWGKAAEEAAESWRAGLEEWEN